LFGMHPKAAEKSRGGVIGFMVRINDLHGTLSRGFHVVHDDRTTTPFSYAPCLNPKKPALGHTAAMRAAIMLSQRAVLIGYFRGREEAPCQHCSQLVARAMAHVHHVPPNRFRDLVFSWVAENGEPEIQKAAIGVEFVSPAVRARWLAYHDAHAVRRIVCPPCNYAAERDQNDAHGITDAAT